MIVELQIDADAFRLSFREQTRKALACELTEDVFDFIEPVVHHGAGAKRTDRQIPDFDLSAEACGERPQLLQKPGFVEDLAILRGDGAVLRKNSVPEGLVTQRDRVEPRRGGGDFCKHGECPLATATVRVAAEG